MPITNVAVIANNDDVYYQTSNGTMGTAAFGPVSSTSWFIVLLRDVALDADAIVSDATADVYVFNWSGGTSFEFAVQAVTSGPIDDLFAEDPSGWSLTTAAGSLTLTSSDLGGVVQIDIADVISEMAQVGWWESGKNIVLVLTKAGGDSNTVNLVQFDHATLPPAEITIDWTSSQVVITGEGAPSAEGFGDGVIVPSSAAIITGDGVSTAEAFGVGSVEASGVAIVSGDGVPSAEALGGGTLLQILIISGDGVPSAEAFGTGVIEPVGAAIVTGEGVSGGEAFGAGAIVPGMVVITSEGIMSAEGFGVGLVTYVFPFTYPTQLEIMNQQSATVEVLNAGAAAVRLLNPAGATIEIIEVD